MAANTTTGPQVRATVRYLHTSPYKVRQVLSLVRGLPVGDAERLLQLCEKDAADDVLKLLGSAIANAEHNNALSADELFVSLAWADEGPTRKHGQPRARGRYFRIRKRTSHVTIVLERFAVDELAERQRRDESSGRGAAVQQRRRAERVRRSRAPEPEPDVDEDDADAGVGEVEPGEVWAESDALAADEVTESETDTDHSDAEPEAEKE